MTVLNSNIPRILTIAGSDSGGGAGIQADIKTITALRGYAMSAITALTAQNTVGVSGIYPVPADFVEKQVVAVLDDIGVDAVKTGMLAESSIVECVAGILHNYAVKKIVVDPVMIAKSGDSLLSEQAVQSVKTQLLPIAQVVTPNIPEAEALAGGKKITNVDDMREAARIIADTGPLWVVIKGGHLDEGVSPVNILYDGHDFYEYEYRRIETRDTHGTGCTFASAAATFLAHGLPVPNAVESAGKAVQVGIENALRLGRGHGPLSHADIAFNYTW